MPTLTQVLRPLAVGGGSVTTVANVDSRSLNEKAAHLCGGEACGHEQRSQRTKALPAAHVNAARSSPNNGDRHKSARSLRRLIVIRFLRTTYGNQMPRAQPAQGLEEFLCAKRAEIVRTGGRSGRCDSIIAYR